MPHSLNVAPGRGRCLPVSRPFFLFLASAHSTKVKESISGQRATRSDTILKVRRFPVGRHVKAFSAEESPEGITTQVLEECRYSAKTFLLSRMSRIAMIGALIGAILCIMPGNVYAAVEAASGQLQQGTTTGVMGYLKQLISFVLHLDTHLTELIAKFGTFTYAMVFAIVFAETGLVVTPFLPGDSLLFATGALAALGKLNVIVLLMLYVTAATIGDAVNYSVGKYFGQKAINAKLIKKEYIEKTEAFYAKYGGKTIVIARFVPIVRTFAPFVAGIGSMAYKAFALYNVFGAVLWTGVCVGAGYAFGNIPMVKDNFSLVVLGIIFVSVVPIAFEMYSMYFKSPKKRAGRSGNIQRDGGSLHVGF